MFVPTYEYQCDKCGRIFEVRQRISEAALTTCEECGGALRRLLSAAPFILKGGGWYVTDYPSESRKKAMQSEKSASEKGPSEKSPSEKSASEKSPPEKSPSEKSPTGTPSSGEKSSTPSSTSDSSGSGASAKTGSSPGE